MVIVWSVLSVQSLVNQYSCLHGDIKTHQIIEKYKSGDEYNNKKFQGTNT